jgi:hypothetical protein
MDRPSIDIVQGTYVKISQKKNYEQKDDSDFETSNETKSKEQISHEARPYSRKIPRRGNMA